MKKYIIGLLLFFNVILITIFVYLFNEYNNNDSVLFEKLDGLEYLEYMNTKNDEKEGIILNIEDNFGYKLDDVDTFDDIKNKLNSKYEELNISNDELKKKKEQLNVQKNNLQNTYNKILEEERKKNSYMIEGVPRINQYSMGYPTGCESAAITSLLKFWGVSVNISDVVNKLPKGSLPYSENGVRYGGNPYLEFVGHPSTYSSYGVYEKPIISVANSFKSGVIDGTGSSLDGVLNIVKEGRPVVVWVSMYMAVPYISTTWIYKPTGEKISWMANEHALVVIGYTPNQVIVADSLNGGIRYYDKGVFRSRYNTYGKRAVYY